jgi:hypothetical protein
VEVKVPEEVLSILGPVSDVFLNNTADFESRFISKLVFEGFMRLQERNNEEAEEHFKKIEEENPDLAKEIENGINELKNLFRGSKK